jgi:hypothetical protein
MPDRPPSPRSAELRPLNTSELLDAALEIARRDLGLYGWLAILALAPLVLLGLRFAVAKGGAAPMDGATHAGHAVVLTLALLWRYVVMGASAIALQRHLAGEQPRLGPCMRAALGRGLSLAVTGALVALVNLILYCVFFANIWLGWFALCAVPLCAERSASGMGSLNTSRRLLAGLGGKAAALNALYLLLAALMLLNCILGAHVLLVIARGLFDLDIAWIQRFLSPANPVFWLISLGVAFTLLEPLRHLTCALLVVDARIRREAHDIRAVFAELARTLAERGRRGAAAAAAAEAPPAPAPAAPPAPVGPPGAAPPVAGGGAALLVLVALLGLAAPAWAGDNGASSLGRRLVEIEEQARMISDPRHPSGHDAEGVGKQAAQLSATERQKLERFVLEGEAQLARVQGLPPDARKREAAQLARRADDVVGAVEWLAERPEGRDARAVARDVLAQPEFQVRPSKEKEKPTGESWWDRLLKKLFKPKPSRMPHTIPVATPGLGGGFFKMLTTVLLVVGAALVLVLVIQWLLRRQRREEDDEPRIPTAADGDLAGPLPDPTKRSTAEWLADADAAAAAGEFRRAVRALYLALLSALCRRGVLRYDPARTNGEYVRQFRGSSDDRTTFRRVTNVSDAAIYGDFAPGADDYGRARTLALQIAGPADEVAP